MIITLHAEEAMEQHAIIEEEVKICIEQGELIIKQLVDGEQRYGKEIMLKDLKLVVIYTYERDEVKIITCYPIRRKKW